MLYRFLKSAKPIHYLLSGIALTLAVAAIFIAREHNFVRVLVGVLLSLTCLGVFEFVLLKNELIKRSAVGIWVFLWLFIACLAAATDLWAMTALVYLLLSLRRIISLRTGREEIAKIFDASFWLALACFINSWYALLFLVVYAGIFLYARTQLRFWFIPFIAILCISILSFTAAYVFELPVNNPFQNNWKLVNWGFLQQGANAFLFYTLLGGALVFLITYVVKIVDINKRVPPYISVLTMLLVVTAVLMLLHSHAPFSAALLMLPALAIVLGSAAYRTQDKILRELLLWVPVGICAMSCLLYL